MIAKFRNHLRKAERGQSIILLAFAFVVLLGFVGLTTDVSLMFVRYATIRRAVDSASLAAATQMRQGTEEAAVAIAARQFVEFHGLDSVRVLVETCQTLDRASPDADIQATVEELCTADQRKLVKVTAQIESPTVFLRLLGWENFTLQASALSETAALDVVLIMDVSESMLTETSLDDWAKVGMGWLYEPPHLAEQVAPEEGKGAEIWNEVRGLSQHELNQKVWYNDPGGDHDAFGTGDNGSDDDLEYRVNVIKLDDDDAYYGTSDFPADASEFIPREDCRVRFSPISQLDGPASNNGRSLEGDADYLNLDDLYSSFGIDWNYTDGTWNGFVPTYDYYACCNDPGIHATDADGPIYHNNGYSQLAGTGADFDFTDLVCQPFKGARDAVELFLEKIDFIRGDRVAFVTFDRSAFLINPWDQDGQDNGLSHMIDRYDVALNTLRRVVGVRAEPNFYVWNDDASGGLDSAGWVTLAAGIGQSADGTTGSVGINYNSTDGSGVDIKGNPIPATDRIEHNFPIYNNCFFGDASNSTAYSPTGGQLAKISHPYGLNIGQDDVTVQTWGNVLVAENFKGNAGVQIPFSLTLDYFAARIGYEYYSECRGTNIGSALREGNNALLDPNTSRRFGAIWVMVLLSDGAAGASDPVRRSGEKIITPNPYYYDTASSTYIAQAGGYGTFGVCPYGTPTDRGELVDVIPEMDSVGSPKFPFCSDEDPASRHECDFRPELPNYTEDGEERSPLWDNDFDTEPNDELGNPITDSQAIIDWNQARGNLYDVDIGTMDCTYYDVDDYARDWVDYIALRDEDSAVEELLPTIYTIGFGLTFDNEDNPDVFSQQHIGDYLGEQMLRYIADAGDNNRLDNDYYQNYADNGSVNDIGLIDSTKTFGLRGPCQDQGISTTVDDTYDYDGNGSLDLAEKADMYGPVPPRQNCGNYFNAPSADQLEFVFDSIASKLFTRLTG